MRCLPLRLLACVVLLSESAAAVAEDPVEKKLAAKKMESDKSAGKARAGLLADLRKRADAAQKAGDLKTLETSEAEIKAFDDKGELPSSVSVKAYEKQMRSSRARLEEAYAAAVTQYTKERKIPQAKAVQQELDALKKKSGPATSRVADLFAAKSVWKGFRKTTVGPNAGKQFPFTLTVISRNGREFTGTASNQAHAWEVAGTVEGGRVEWKVTKVLAGQSQGQTHTGLLSGEKLIIKYDGPGDGGQTIRGDGELTLDRQQTGI